MKNLEESVANAPNSQQVSRPKESFLKRAYNKLDPSIMYPLVGASALGITAAVLAGGIIHNERDTGIMLAGGIGAFAGLLAGALIYSDTQD